MDKPTRPNDGLEDLLEYYFEYSEQDSLDPDIGLDDGIRHFRNSGLSFDRARTELATLLAADLDDSALHEQTVPCVPLPAGRSARLWLTYVASRLEEAASAHGMHGDANFVGSGYQARSRLGLFTDDRTAHDATQRVLWTREEALSAWLADSGGISRLHLVADVAARLCRTVGTVTPDTFRTEDDPEPESVETGTCAVLLHRTDPGHMVILTAYPDLPADDAVRERYPTLPALFGGFFNQEVIFREGNLWFAERHFHLATGPAAKLRIADELGRLLDDTAGNDSELQAALQSLGSFTVAADPRRWVSGLRRRITDLDWTS